MEMCCTVQDAAERKSKHRKTKEDAAKEAKEAAVDAADL
jgi:hypothetical protein